MAGVGPEGRARVGETGDTGIAGCSASAAKRRTLDFFGTREATARQVTEFETRMLEDDAFFT